MNRERTTARAVSYLEIRKIRPMNSPCCLSGHVSLWVSSLHTIPDRTVEFLSAFALLLCREGSEIGGGRELGQYASAMNCFVLSRFID